MDSNTSSLTSTAKQDRQPDSRSKDGRRGPVRSSRHSASLQELKVAASQCHTPKQFRELLDQLQPVIPYKKLAVSWGYHTNASMRFVYNHSFPADFLRWYLATGALWKSVIFQEWLRTRRTLMWCDVAKRLKAKFDPEMLKRVKQAGLQYSLCGGFTSRDYYVWFNAAMESEQSGRTHLKPFEFVVPSLVQASQRAYPRTLLTKRETAVLERRAMGEIVKQIARAEGITDRTVRMHLQRIKQKLYTDDLVNAVVIAVRSGMIGRSAGTPGS